VPYYYTPWRLVGACDWSGLLEFRREQRWTDGSGRVEVEIVCVDPGGGEPVVWGVLVEEIEALSDARWESNPDNAVSPGLTGLETWLWYSGETTIGPIEVSWSDPTVGVVFEVEGRAWTATLRWVTGDGGDVSTRAEGFGEAAAVGGSVDDPAGRYVYETSAADAGFEGGYPVEMSLGWVGEWRTRTVGGSWGPWQPMTNTYLDVFTGSYDVWQIRSVLTG
jgi:hypothetical protein